MKLVKRPKGSVRLMKMWPRAPRWLVRSLAILPRSVMAPVLSPGVVVDGENGVTIRLEFVLFEFINKNRIQIDKLRIECVYLSDKDYSMEYIFLGFSLHIRLQSCKTK